MLVVVLSLAWGWRMLIFQLSGCYCTSCELGCHLGLASDYVFSETDLHMYMVVDGSMRHGSCPSPKCYLCSALIEGGSNIVGSLPVPPPSYSPLVAAK